MKRYLVIGLLFVFFLGGVSASEPPQPVTCSDSNQTILRLESYYNAHGEVWNGTTSYPYEICFNDYFDGNWTGANPHACTGNNLVLNLSDLTDASSDGPGTSGNFNVPVCYGDLSCELRKSIDSCEDFGDKRGAPIFSISAQTDGHLAKGGRYNSTTEDLVVCCYSAIPPICKVDGYCDTGAGETPENCRDCVNGPICDLDGERGGYEECDCGSEGVNALECTPLQLGGETCNSLTGTPGRLRCDANCKFDTRECNPPTDTFCTQYKPNFWWDDSGTSHRVEYCNEVNDMNDKDGYSGSIESFREEACNKCSSTNDWWKDIAYLPSGINPTASSQNCVWSDGECKLNLTYTGGLICQQEWTDETACDENGFRSVTIVHTKVSGEGTCPADETVNIACSSVIQLPFLSTGGIVAIIILIALIYFIYLKKKKRK